MNDLLGLLDHPDSNRGSARVLIAEALKSLTHSLAHGDEVSAILNKSPVWQQYSQQDHALFIQNDTSLQITHAASGKLKFSAVVRTPNRGFRVNVCPLVLCGRKARQVD